MGLQRGSAPCDGSTGGDEGLVRVLVAHRRGGRSRARAWLGITRRCLAQFGRISRRELSRKNGHLQAF